MSDIEKYYRWRKMSPNACWMISKINITPCTNCESNRKFDVVLEIIYASAHGDKNGNPYSPIAFIQDMEQQVGKEGRYELAPWTKSCIDCYCFIMKSTVTQMY